MYFLRWIAGYPILIILLVAGLYALYNKDNLAHWFTKNEPTEQAAEAGHAQDAAATVADASGSEHSAYVAEEAASPELSQPSGDMTNSESTGMPGYPEMGAAVAPSEMRGMPPMPEMGEIPSMPPMDDIPPMPEMGEMPPIPEMEAFPPMDDIPPMPAMMDQSPMPEFPPMEGFPEMSEPEFVPPMGSPVAMAPAAEPYGDAQVERDIEVVVEKEERTGSWLDIFKGKDKASDAPAEDADEVAVSEEIEETKIVVVESPDASADAEVSDTEEEKSGSWLDIFKGKDESSDASVEEMSEAAAPEQVEETKTAAVESATAPVDAEVSDTEEEKSGSWLDIFKTKKDEPAEASVSAQSEQAAAETEAGVETAKVEKEDEKSGSWLDIFKGKKEAAAVEESSDYQQQHEESLRLAREAFWKRDFEAAEAIYANMTKAEPENAELLGEYGNVLLQAGKMGEALDTYEKVAELLIANGRLAELRPLMFFIGDQDPERARKLDEKIRSQQTTQQ